MFCYQTNRVLCLLIMLWLSPLLRPQSVYAQQNTPPCSVVSQTLNLRSGPGVEYQPAIYSIPQDKKLVALTRNDDTSWVQVQVAGTGYVGWVNAAARYITCTINLRTLDISQVSPPPTNGPPIAYQGSAVATPGANSGDVIGIVTVDGTYAYENHEYDGEYFAYEDILTLRDRFYVSLYAWDPREGNADGAGIDRVEFRIYGYNDEYDENSDGTVYSKVEVTPQYCINGGDQLCTGIDLSSGVWPNTNRPIRSGYHELAITAYPKDQDRQEGNWRVNFYIAQGSIATPPVATQLQVTVAQAATTDALVFQVAAYDPSIGNYDGAGVQSVDLYLYGVNNELLYDRTEQAAPYCLFTNIGTDPCNVWKFAENNYSWPNGQPIRAGVYTLYAEVTFQSDRIMPIEQTIRIQ